MEETRKGQKGGDKSTPPINFRRSFSVCHVFQNIQNNVAIEKTF